MKASSQPLAMFAHLLKSDAIFQAYVAVYNQLYSVRHDLPADSARGCSMIVSRCLFPLQELLEKLSSLGISGTGVNSAVGNGELFEFRRRRRHR